MLFKEAIAVHCENHTEYTDALCDQNAECWCVKAGGLSRVWALGKAVFRWTDNVKIKITGPLLLQNPSAQLEIESKSDEKYLRWTCWQKGR
jgi:hypothetical protein